MKLTRLTPFFISILLIACSGNSEVSESGSDSTSENNRDTTAMQDEMDFSIKTLPGLEGVDLMSEPYTVNKVLASIESEYNAGQTLTVVVSDNQDLIIEIDFDQKGSEESWKTDVIVENAEGMEVKLEYTDANYDDVKDELVIWWSQTDEQNGIMAGFESAKSGVIIFDVIQRNEIVNFTYSHRYASYSAAENANSSDPDYHAKAADDTEWFICGFNHDVKLVDGDLIVSNFTKEHEGTGECYHSEYAAGKYTYNYSSGYFEHEQNQTVSPD